MDGDTCYDRIALDFRFKGPRALAVIHFIALFVTTLLYLSNGSHTINSPKGYVWLYVINLVIMTIVFCNLSNRRSLSGCCLRFYKFVSGIYFEAVFMNGVLLCSFYVWFIIFLQTKTSMPILLQIVMIIVLTGFTFFYWCNVLGLNLDILVNLQRLE